MQGQDTSQENTDDPFSAGSAFSGSFDDYRHGGQGGVGQLSGTGQPQTGNIEEFPPLGRNGSDENGQDRRGSLMQNAAFAGFSNPNTFNLPQDSAQTRQGLSRIPNGQMDRGSATLADRIMSPNAMGFGGTAALDLYHDASADEIQHHPQVDHRLSHCGQTKVLWVIRTKMLVSRSSVQCKTCNTFAGFIG